MTTVSVFAPAKINLTLHVTGQRDDGYHLIDTLVAFAPVGDQLVIQDGNTLSLTIEGPEAAGVPADMGNLALRAAAIFGGDVGAALTLEKNLPRASGMGGGSADAAAALRGILMHREDWIERNWDALEDELRMFAEQILALGADVPMCLLSKTCRARGIGEKIEFLDLPALPAILVNPRVPVATAEVFDALRSRNNAPMSDALPTFADAAALTDWLAGQRNDLEAPAIEAAPIIADVLGAIRATDGCALARMSGSGATCFGLYADKDSAVRAGEAVRAARPEWWVAGGLLADWSGRAIPKVS